MPLQGGLAIRYRPGCQKPVAYPVLFQIRPMTLYTFSIAVTAEADLQRYSGPYSSRYISVQVILMRFPMPAPLPLRGTAVRAGHLLLRDYIAGILLTLSVSIASSICQRRRYLRCVLSRRYVVNAGPFSWL